MIYSYPNNCFPDLNYFLAPSCSLYTYKEQSYYLLPTDLFQPRTVKIQVLCKEDYKVSSANNFQIIPEKVEEEQEDTDHTAQKSKELFSIEKSTTPIISDHSITEFNTNKKLKKIHSTYHLKRKISTKLQNDIKVMLNCLIEQSNMKNSFKLPFVSPNTKEFREDVKIQSLKMFSQLTIGEYICENVNAGRSLNKLNIALLEKVSLSYKISPCDSIKKLYQLLNKTFVKDYYEMFIKSQRFQKCYQKDIKKYETKLNQLKFSEEIKKKYQKIFGEKYSGIAKSYFTCE